MRYIEPIRAIICMTKYKLSNKRASCLDSYLSLLSHSWVRGLQVYDIKKCVYCLVLFSIIAQLISRSGSDTISNTV